ncbi:MAG TPA: GGDEF domain-containing protein [Wenzhouxiangella sp.]|nr:GGDEF domain-containing protein [Wenzhouxiangella sp.]
MRRAFAFETTELERAFQRSLHSEKIRLARVVAVLAIALIVSFAPLDLWALPSAVVKAWLLRAGMLLVAVPVLAASGHPRVIRHYLVVMALLFSVLAAGIIAMTTLAAPGDPALDSYPVGLILVIIGLFTLSYLPLWCSVLLTLAIITAYGLLAFTDSHPQAAGQGSLLAAHLFFLVATGIMGAVAQAVRDRHSRESFLLRMKLQHDVRLRGEAARRATELARRDPLTELANRRHLLEVLDGLLARTGQDRHIFAFYIDLDGFKPLNDAHGHAAGDRVLAVLGERLRTLDDSLELVARCGGDEFVAVSDAAASGGQSIDTLASDMLARISEPVALRGQSVTLSASIGVAVGPEDGRSAEALIEAADGQMYRAKRDRSQGNIAYSAAAERMLAS